MPKMMFVLAMLASIGARAAERYIIPIWGVRVQGATGTLQRPEPCRLQLRTDPCNIRRHFLRQGRIS